MPFMGDRSIINPPSQVDCPDRLWPPPFTAVSSEYERANCTARTTSAVLAQRAMSAG